MKLISFSSSQGSGIGLVVQDQIVRADVLFGAQHRLSMLEAITQLGLQFFGADAESRAAFEAELASAERLPLDQVHINAPITRPNTLRDFYAFEAHVKNARERRGLGMIPEWYQVPVFYFSNPGAIFGPDDTISQPKSSVALDFELEVAAIIGKTGRDITVEEAESYIVGYTIMNDWSARDLQMLEMAVGLGPAKGKDFATSLGPWLVTPDELEDRRSGKGYSLGMVARRNGVEISRGNWNTLYYSFAEMIARASADCTLYAGDVIGSGTVGTGCILELGPENVGGWLQPGDVIELEVERLGVLRNTVGAR